MLEMRRNDKKLIKDYSIKLFGCKNGDEINYLSFEEFEKSQNIDESKIICDECKEKDKGNIFNNIFYKCNSCQMNLCPLCKSSHESHYLINYDLKDYICENHNEKYISYCQKCKKNICIICMSDAHSNHELNIFKIFDKNKKIFELPY